MVFEELSFQFYSESDIYLLYGVWKRNGLGSVLRFAIIVWLL